MASCSSKRIVARSTYFLREPDYPLSIHWGTGVIFYLIERSTGFQGLSLAFIALSVATLWLFLNLAVKLSSFPIAAISAIVCMPILITRYEIRPEAFTYLLSALFLQFLWRYKMREAVSARLFLRAASCGLMHIYFTRHPRRGIFIRLAHRVKARTIAACAAKPATRGDSLSSWGNCVNPGDFRCIVSMFICRVMS